MRWAIDLLDIAERATVGRGDVAELAREPSLAGTFDVAVARAFGRPSVVAECATGYLVLGGRLVVSEPGDGSEARWPEGPLARLGLAVRPGAGEPRFVELVKTAPHEGRFPRRFVAMQRDPLY